MPIWRLQASAAADSLFPADNIIITPHFNDQGVGTDPQGLCDDLAAALGAYYSGPRQVTVKAYDAQGTPPVYPAATAIVNEGLAPATAGVREVAVCLSYYAGFNRPRLRGRLYLCPSIFPTGTTSAARPPSATRIKVGELATILADLGGLDVDWSVFSRVDNVARPVSNWWVDDAWDVQRSRGLRPTVRLQGTVSE